MISPLHFSLGFWDKALICTVTLQTTVLAYSHSARAKAFIYSLPFPFTVAALAVGRPIGVVNLAAISVLFCYLTCVRLCYEKLRIPIVLSILIGMAVYVLISLPLVAFLPQGQHAFWWGVALSLLGAALLLKWMPQRMERGHRTPVPIYLKIPIIALVVLGLVLSKEALQGTVTSFPMVGVVGAYEARHSLYTLGRVIPILMLSLTPMIVCIYLLQGAFGLPLALAAGWIVYLILLTLVNLSPINRPLGTTRELQEGI